MKKPVYSACEGSITAAISAIKGAIGKLRGLVKK